MDVVVDDSPCVTKSKCTTRGSSGVDRSPGLPERERGESGEGQRSERVLLMVIVADAKKQARARGHTTPALGALTTLTRSHPTRPSTPPRAPQPAPVERGRKRALSRSHTQTRAHSSDGHGDRRTRSWAKPW